MSSFVCSDHTVLAICEGMSRYGYINEDDIPEMADALRIINERMTAGRYCEDAGHAPVDCGTARGYRDHEIRTSCQCWLYQCDGGPRMSLDEITVHASVRQLIKRIEAENIGSGKWQLRAYLGMPTLLAVGEDGFLRAVDDLSEWDLTA